MIETINIILIIFMLICAFTAVHVKELVSAVFLMGAFSFFLSILWSVLAAPDVSFTEAMVGAGTSTIFMLLALFGASHECKNRDYKRFPWLAMTLVTGLGAFFIWASLDLPWLGELEATASQYLSPFYLQNAYEQTKTPNAVTAVVVDYRGFDTLIEATVIFTAGVACMLIMKRRSEYDSSS